MTPHHYTEYTNCHILFSVSYDIVQSKYLKIVGLLVGNAVNQIIAEIKSLLTSTYSLITKFYRIDLLSIKSEVGHNFYEKCMSFFSVPRN